MILVLTSILFSIPAIIAHKKNLVRDKVLATTITSISTINHLLQSKNKIVCKIDIGIAHTICTVFVLDSLFQKNGKSILPIITILNTACIYYKKAHSKNKNKYAKIWHATMHITTCLGWSMYLLLK